MANKNRPNGFRPSGEALRETPYVAASAIYPGDIVKITADGKVAVAAASDAVCGVAATYASADGKEVMVWDHPDQKFIAQADAGTTLAQTNVGLNYDFVAATASTAFRQSRQVVDSSTGTAAVLPLQLLGYSREEGRAGAQERADCIVRINNHQLSSGTGRAGV